MTANNQDLNRAIYSYTINNTSTLEEENRALKTTVHQLQKELDKLSTPALMVAEVRDVKENNAIIKIPNGNEFYVNMSDKCKGITPGDSVLVEQKNLNVVRRLSKIKTFNVDRFVIIGKPKTAWDEIGGLDK